MLKQVVLLLAVIGLLQSAAAKNLPGAFKAEAMAFYVVHKGGPLKIAVGVTASKDAPGKIVCRFFDANEKLVKWDYGKIKPGESVSYYNNFGPDAPKGIYQMRYSGKNITVDLKTVPEASFGIMPLRCMLNATSNDQFKKAWFYIPPGYDSFTIRGIGIQGNIYDASGKEVVTIGSKNKKIDIKGKVGQVWSIALKMKPGAYYRFGVSGMPLILCPDQKTAMAIAGSMEKTSDGKYFPHKFQVKMYEWIKSLKKNDLELKIADLRNKKKLEADDRAGALFGRWSFLDYLLYTLKHQDIDPASKTFGTGGNPTSLALIYSLKKPWNPYYHDPVIEKRLLLAQFQRLLILKENDSRDNSCSSYSGGDALLFLQFPSSSFCFAGKEIQDKKLAELWAGAVRRIPDRFSMFRVSCENQSSHWPVAYLYMAKGTGEKGYVELAKDYISGMSLPENNAFMKTGYQQEAYGPDATYQGLGACYQALYYRMTGNDIAKKGLDTIYNLFNHTVAPEPDGKKIFGASLFAHRTAGSWTTPQYGAGRQLMKGELESAAVWYRNIDDIDYSKKLDDALLKPHKTPEKSKRGQTVSTYSTSLFGPLYSNYLYPSKKIKNAKLPVERSSSFTRNFNNEFICVRRPSYYAFAYIGKTAAEWTKSRVMFKPYNKKPVYKWNQTQGLGMFWTPDFGSNLLAMNWTADTANIIRADISDDKCDLPSYWSLSSNFDPDTMTLLMNWKMFKTPVDIQRKITFGEKSIKVKVRLRFTGDVKIRNMFEQLPFVKKDGITIEFDNAGKWQDKPCKTAAVRFRNGAGAGVLYKFKNPHDMSFGPESKATWDKSQVNGVVRIHLGGVFKKNKLARVQYEIIPIKMEK